MQHATDHGKLSLGFLAAGSLELRVQGATDEQLAAGLTQARRVLARHGISAGRAVVCQSAVLAHELDPSLPRPEADVRDAAAACKEAWTAAILAAGGRLDAGDELAFEQSAEDARLWDELPTLRAWKLKNSAEKSSKGDAPTRAS